MTETRYDRDTEHNRYHHPEQETPTMTTTRTTNHEPRGGAAMIPTLPPESVHDAGDGLVFVTDGSWSYDAWGARRIDGALFDTIAGTVQPGAWCSGAPWLSDAEIIAGAASAVIDGSWR